MRCWWCQFFLPHLTIQGLLCVSWDRIECYTVLTCLLAPSTSRTSCYLILPPTLYILPGHAWQEDSLVAATNLSYGVQLLVAPCCTRRHMPRRALKRGEDAEGNSRIDLFWLTKGSSHHDDPKLRVLTSASVLLAAVEFLSVLSIWLWFLSCLACTILTAVNVDPLQALWDQSQRCCWDLLAD